jgi:hypothetical protein
MCEQVFQSVCDMDMNMGRSFAQHLANNLTEAIDEATKMELLETAENIIQLTQFLSGKA